VPRTRRQVRRSPATDAWITGAVTFLPATGDLIACRSAWGFGLTLHTLPPLLCVFASLRGGRMGGLCVLSGSNELRWICVYLRYLRFLRPEGIGYQDNKQVGSEPSVFFCVICGQQSDRVFRPSGRPFPAFALRSAFATDPQAFLDRRGPGRGRRLCRRR